MLFQILATTVMLDLALASTHYTLADSKSAEPLVVATETVELIPDGERRVTTYAAIGQSARQQEIYETTPTGVPRRFTFNDPSTGEKIEVVDAGDRWAMSYRESATATERRVQVPKEPRMLPGKAIPSLILDQWTALSSGTVVKFDLLVPQQLTSYGFDVRRQLDEPLPTFVVEASNWLVRQFAPKIVFVFDEGSPHRLRLYNGPAAVQIRGEKHRNVVIDFVGSSGADKAAEAVEAGPLR